MSRPHEWSRWRHPSNPATTIAEIIRATRHPVGSEVYRRLMTLINVDVFTRPDYPELVQLANTLTARYTRREKP